MATPLSLPGQDDEENTQNQGQGTSVNLNSAANPMGTPGGQPSPPPSATPPPSTSSGVAAGPSKPTAQSSAGAGFSNNFKPTSSGSFTNLQNYLNANQNNNVASGISSNIQNQANTTQTNINNANAAFGAANTASQNPYSTYTTNPGGAGAYATGVANQAIAGNSVAPTDQTTVSGLEGANYSGPTGLESLSGNNNLSNLTQQTSNISQQAQEANTEGGRYNLLNQIYGNGKNYTAGQQGLDQALMQTSPTSMSTLGNLQHIANTVGNNLNASETAAQQQAGTSSAQDQAIAQATQQALNNATQTYLQGLPGYGGGSSLASYQPGGANYIAHQNAINAVTDELNNPGGTTPAAQAVYNAAAPYLSQVNITPNSSGNINYGNNNLSGPGGDLGYANTLMAGGQYVVPQTSGVDSLTASGAPSGLDASGNIYTPASELNSNGQFLGQFFNPNNTAATQANILNSGQYNTIDALNSLLGGNGSQTGNFTNSQTGADLTPYLGNASQAGGFNSMGTFNQSAFAQAVQNAINNGAAAPNFGPHSRSVNLPNLNNLLKT